MTYIKIETYSEDETIAAAADFAQNLKSGDVVLFHGDLGVGKSVFARSIIRTLSHDEGLIVPSPTFTLVQTYQTDAFVICHFDLYRLNDPEEIYEIGWEDATGGGCVVLIEWPIRLGDLKPNKAIDITLSSSHDNVDKRLIEIVYP